jgi:hypothetical protein
MSPDEVTDYKVDGWEVHIQPAKNRRGIFRLYGLTYWAARIDPPFSGDVAGAAPTKALAMSWARKAIRDYTDPEFPKDIGPGRGSS